MTIEQFKSYLYNKDIEKIKSLDLENPIVQSNVEYFILASFFQSYVQGKRYLAENFTKNLWKWLINKDHINELIQDDSSLFNIFPSCGKTSLFSDSQKHVCERLFLNNEGNVYRSVLSNLYSYRRKKQQDLGWSDETFVMRDTTVKYIAKIMPKDYNDLKKIFHFQKDKNFKRDANNVINLVKEARENPRTHWGCGSRNEPCASPELTEPNLNGDYNNYHYYSWLAHWDIKPDHPHFSKESSDLVAFKLTAYLNRLIDIAPQLECYECNETLVPNWKYAKKDGAAYSVTVFWCNKDNCGEYHKGIYINHCVKAAWCGSVIDQRVNTEKCDNGLYICRSETGYGGECTGCCVDHYKKEINS